MNNITQGLSSHKIRERFNNEISRIENSHNEDIDRNVFQFLHFLENQPISKNILDRIKQDYGHIGSKLKTNVNKRIVKEIVSIEEQNALAYFILDKEYLERSGSNRAYLRLTMRCFSCGPEMIDRQSVFNNEILFRFKEIFESYLLKGESIDEKDYFSIQEQTDFFNYLNEISLENQEIINEIQILKNEILGLKEEMATIKKKSFRNLLIGTIQSKVIESALSKESVVFIWKAIEQHLPKLEKFTINFLN